MVPKDTGQQRYRKKHAYSCAVIQVIWIAAFFFSTKYEYFLHIPPGINGTLTPCAPVIQRVRFFAPILRDNDSGQPHCRSPPSDFDFASPLKKSKLEDNP
ncbi:MAG: hypothetical protein ACI4PT_08290 [Candidatus Avoscillospira sp.]